MISIAVPDFGALALEHLVLDFNGTLAAADIVVPTIGDALDLLAHPLRLVASLRD
jgi:hypothetical protein